jgi:CHAT domain-containing protein/tetratricopeptide (TPR) repeat protein
MVFVAGSAGAQTPRPADVAKLQAMKKAADDLDEAADPAAYRAAWEKVAAFARTLYPAGHIEIAVAEAEFVTADYLQGNVQGALARADLLVGRLRTAGPAYDTMLTDTLNSQLVILMTLGRHDRSPAVAAELLARRQKQYGDTPSSPLAAAYSNAANAEYEAGNYDRAITLVRRAATEARRLKPVPPNAAVWLSNVPVFLAGAGRLEEAVEAAQNVASEMDTFLPAAHPHFGPNFNNMARFQLQLGRAGDAVGTARRAVAIADKNFGEKQQTATYLSTLAQALNAQGKFVEARTVAETSVRILERDLGAESDRTMVAKETLAQSLAGAGDPVGAMALLQAVAEVRARKLPPHHRDRIGGGDRMATLALRLGRLDAARDAQVAAQALRLASLPADDLGTLAGEARLAAIEARLGRREAGLARATAATTALDRRLRDMAASGAARTGHDREARTGYGWALDAALEAGDAAAAFRYAQRFTATSAGRAASAAAARQTTGDAAVAELLRRRQDAAAALERQRDRQLRAASRGAPQEAATALRVERTALEAELARLSAELRRRSPQLLANELPEPLTLDAARAALGPGEAVLFAAVGPTRTALFALSNDRAEMVASPLDAERTAALVVRVRAGIGDSDRPPPFDFAASADLHAGLLPAPILQVIAGKPRLLVAANGPLAALPFATLAPAARAPTLRSARWLVRDHALSVLPSVAALAERTSRSGSGSGAAAQQFVAVGAPVLAATAAGGRPAFRSAGMAAQVRDLPTLPATATELEALGKAMGSPRRLVLTGANATEAAVRAADLAPGGVLAFATHGLMAGELDGLEEPALVLTPAGEDDGLLTAGEIMRLRIGADWVVLSACNTAAGADSDDAGLTGLSRAFLHAGARNLLASHWPIRDDAAAWLTVETIRRYGGGVEPAEALRQAMLAMIDRRPVPGAGHPAQWAPFILVGR